MDTKRVIFLVLLLFFFSLNAFFVLARPFPYAYATALPQEKTFAPNTHFQTDLFTGAATYDYNLKVSPGTNDLTPELSLSYNSYWRSTRPGIVGDGWRLTENYVQRFVNYTRDDAVDDEFRLVLNGVYYTLLNSTTDNHYHSDIESFLDIQYMDHGGNNVNGTYWQVRTKDGTTYLFGYTNDSEHESNYNPNVHLVWRWSLSSIVDPYGNSINYTYLEGDFASYGAIYPNSTIYNRDEQRVIEFIYDTSDRLDLWRVYEEGNHINEKRRIKEINIIANGQIVRAYQLTYNTTDKNSYSRLERIIEIGSDGQQALPATTFTYHEFLNSWTQDSSYNLPECCFVDATTQEDQGMRLVDVNRDGLVDLIRARHTTPFNPAAAVWLNQKGSWGGTDEILYPNGCSSTTGNSLCIVIDGKDNGVRFADVNSDGFADIIKAADPSSGSPTSSVYLGTGTGWTLSSTFLYPKCSSAEGNDLCFMRDEKDHGVQLVEVNGDGFIDIIKAREGFSQRESSIWLNNGSGWLESSITYPGCQVSDGSLCFITTRNSVDGEDNGVRMIDVNNDGLDDIVMARRVENVGGASVVLLNTGVKWDNENITHFRNTRCEGVTTDFCFVDEGGADYGVRLVDYNGDGLVDIVRARTTTSTAGQTVIGVNAGDHWSYFDRWEVPNCDASSNNNCFIYLNNVDHATRLVDINGDGVADIVRARGPGQQYATYLNDGYRTNLLHQVNNSLGGSHYIYYEKATSLNSSGGPDYLPDLGTPLLVVAKTVDYNGMLNGHITNVSTDFNYTDGVYDYPKREFRGFGNVTEIKSNATLVSHLFFQDDSRKGREYETEIIDHKTRLSYQQQRFTWNTSFVDGYYIVHLLDENITHIDGFSDNPKITNTSYLYDIYGNVVTKIQDGDVTVNGDERYEYFEFVYNTDKWIVDSVKRYLLYDDFANTTKFRETQYTYDGLMFDDAPTHGDITKEEKVNVGGTNAITIYGYDGYGNVDNITDPNNRFTNYTFGLRDTTYTFADQEINAKGHVTNRWFDLGTGNLLNVSDANGFITSSTYDVFGRIATEVKPMDNDQYPTKTYTYSFDGVAPEEVKVSLRETNATVNTLDMYEFVDGLGKIIQTKLEAENGKQIVEDTYYDGQLRIFSKSNKYLIDATVNYSEPSTTVPATNFTYDVLDRQTSMLNPDLTIKYFTYDHWNVTETDENNNNKTLSKDAHGNNLVVLENNAAIMTTYFYNAANELLDITDIEGNAFLFFYDTLGRKTSQIDPDLGIWNYTYDGVGNLLTTKDNRGFTTTNTYDELNRITTKTNADGTYDYFYDEQLLGTLSSVGSADFARNYTYDERLRLATDTKTIDALTDTFVFSYDSLDRPTSVVWDGVDNFTLTYSDQGIASGIEGILDFTTHNELNAVLARMYNNSEVTNFTYNESNFRLQRIQTDTKQDISYDFDNISNIISINDTANDRSYAMTYDILSRLVAATRWDASQIIFDFAHVYDNLGRILNATSTAENLTYYYNGTPAHAPYRIDYEFAGQGLQLESLGDLSGSGFTRIFEFIINNTENMTLTDLNWTVQTGIDNITSELLFNLSAYEDIFVYVEYNYTNAGNYTVTAVAENQQYYDISSIQITVP